MTSTIGVAAVAIVIAGIAVYALATQHGGASDSSNVDASACGEHPFSHVYNPGRLRVLAKCRIVTGVIERIKQEPDGDLHIRLRADDASLINGKNVSDQQGDLVLEPVCVGPVTQEDAKDACDG